MSGYMVVRPVYERAEPGIGYDGKPIYWDKVARWIEVGPAASVQDAKRRYSPVQYGYAVVLRDGDIARAEA